MRQNNISEDDGSKAQNNVRGTQAVILAGGMAEGDEVAKVLHEAK